MVLRPKFREGDVDVILSFLRHHVKESGRKGVVVGMSGGVDSSLVAKLCADAIGPAKVLGLALPETSGGEDERDARGWAKRLGIRFRALEIGPVVDRLARQLRIPRRILEKVPTAGLWRGQTDEGELGIPYDALDRVLLGIELQLLPEEIAERADVPVAQVRRIERLVAANVHKRKTPLIPKVGIRTFGLDWRE